MWKQQAKERPWVMVCCWGLGDWDWEKSHMVKSTVWGAGPLGSDSVFDTYCLHDIGQVTVFHHASISPSATWRWWKQLLSRGGRRQECSPVFSNRELRTKNWKSPREVAEKWGHACTSSPEKGVWRRAKVLIWHWRFALDVWELERVYSGDLGFQPWKETAKEEMPAANHLPSWSLQVRPSSQELSLPKELSGTNIRP